MDLVLDSYTIANIFNFLELESICNYDNAVTSKFLRPLYLDAISKIRIYQIRSSKWTYLRNIKILNTNCKYYNLEYFPEYNNKITICGYIFHEKEIYNLKIIQHKIEYLHIGIPGNNINIAEIRGDKIKEIVFVYIINIEEDVLKNISETCPMLEKIKFIKCNIQIEKLIPNDKIKIYICG